MGGAFFIFRVRELGYVFFFCVKLLRTKPPGGVPTPSSTHLPESEGSIKANEKIARAGLVRASCGLDAVNDRTSKKQILFFFLTRSGAVVAMINYARLSYSLNPLRS